MKKFFKGLFKVSKCEEEDIQTCNFEEKEPIVDEEKEPIVDEEKEKENKEKEKEKENKDKDKFNSLSKFESDDESDDESENDLVDTKMYYLEGEKGFSKKTNGFKSIPEFFGKRDITSVNKEIRPS